MNHELRQEFGIIGFEMAKSLSNRLEKHGMRLGSTAPKDVAIWTEAMMAWLSGFLNGLGLETKRVDASLAQGVTAFRRFYTSESLKS